MTNQQVSEKAKEASYKIQEILEEGGLALQPFLSFSEYGVVPRVRLVDTSENTDDKESDSQEDGGGEEEPKPADSE